MATPLWLGFGCRRGCSALELGALLLDVLHSHDLRFHQLRGIASIAVKADEPGLLALARRLDMPLITFDPGHLLPYADRLSHRSARSYAENGCLGVAESSALALAEQQGEGHARLLVTRHHTPLATLAIATVAAPRRPATPAT